MSAALELAETPNETENIKIVAKVISSVFLKLNSCPLQII